MIEILTFRLASGDHEAAFLDADRRVQIEAVPNQPGFLRRTTARSNDGEWVVVTLWASADDADRYEATADHPAMVAFEALLEPATIQTKRYETLD
ncbi:hypothetical protein BH24ACT3_BH24ACT3_04080 [soil metagenome]